MKVAILGSGPAAAYAVMACREEGIVPTVISDRSPQTDQVGAFFLHWLPPWLVDYAGNAAVTVLVQARGTAECYTAKQWGRVVPSSFPAAPRKEVWYNSAVLGEVWKVQEVGLAPGRFDDADLLRLGGEYDFVFHTFSAEAVRGGARRLIWFPVLTFRSGPQAGDMGMVMYNGEPKDRWVRMTRAFGRVSIEYPRDQAELAMREDPVCAEMEYNKLRDIHPDTLPLNPWERIAGNVIPIGRFATWNRKALSHDSYNTVKEVLNRWK